MVIGRVTDINDFTIDYTIDNVPAGDYWPFFMAANDEEHIPNEAGEAVGLYNLEPSSAVTWIDAPTNNMGGVTPITVADGQEMNGINFNATIRQ